MIRLRIDEKVYELDLDVIKIGRKTVANVVIEDKKVSKFHSEIHKTPDGYLLIDLNSKNGTFLNDNKIRKEYLKQGDRIKVGDTIIKVEYVSIEPKKVAESVPLEHKLMTKQKLQRVRSYYSRRPGALSIVLPIAILLLCVVFIWMIIKTLPEQQPETKSSPPEKRPIAETVADEVKLPQRQAQEALKKFMAKVDKEKFITDALLIELNELAKTYGYSEEFYRALEYLYQKQQSCLVCTYERFKTELDIALSSKRFADAYKIRQDYFQVVREYPDFEKFAQQLEKVFNDEIKTNREEFEELVKIHLERADFAAALNLCNIYLKLFNDTPVVDTINERIKDINRQQQLALERARIEKEKQEAQARKLKKEAEQTLSKKMPDDIRTALIALINGGRFRKASIQLDEKTRALILSADENSIVISARNQERSVPWDEVDPLAIYRMCLYLPPKGEDYYKLAVYCFANDLIHEGSDCLYKYASKPGTPEREKAYQLISMVRKIPVPEGGFIYDHREKIWETPLEKYNREVLAKLEEKARALATTTTLKTLEKKFNEIYETYYKEKDEKITPETREKMQECVKKNLEEARAKFLVKIKKAAARSAKDFDKLHKAYEQLVQARKDALVKIYDEQFYPYERGVAPSKNHDKIDELVKKVREIWENPAKIVISLNTKLVEEIKTVSKINEFMKKIGAVPDEDSLKEIDHLLNNLNERISIKNYCPDSKTSSLYQYNRKVDEYNKNLELPEGCKDEFIRQQVFVLNEYREMMGRRRVFLCPKLIQAAQYHSGEMAKAGYIWHEGPDGTPASRAQKFGHSPNVGENVAMGYPSPEAVHNGWYTSSGHHRNMLSDMWSCIGVGHVNNFWTQKFSTCPLPSK